MADIYISESDFKEVFYGGEYTTLNDRYVKTEKDNSVLVAQVFKRNSDDTIWEVSWVEPSKYSNTLVDIYPTMVQVEPKQVETTIYVMKEFK